MNAHALASSEVEQLQSAAFTYNEVGATRHGPLPSGYAHLQRMRVIGSGIERFEQAAQSLLGWGMHRRAGLQVYASTELIVSEAVAVLRLGSGKLSVHAPVRIVHVIDEPHRKGFAYGTLPGHPESGEEAFVVELDSASAVTLTVSAFSRPATLLARAGGPLTSVIQSWITNRYLRSV